MQEGRGDKRIEGIIGAIMHLLRTRFQSNSVQHVRELVYCDYTITIVIKYLERWEV